MARIVAKLSPAKVAALVKAGKPGLYGDGAGLGLRIGRNGSASWVQRYMRQGTAREMGLGAVHTIGLAEARERARRHRQELLDGIDPLAQRQA
ncbi:MAG TPA: Arm DNA-binding domain-containing protein, partial [Acetobacteraceae bacterium]|nr:Arm DNA-binding domain-containing protein [Acetobacteraceae bacterium]